MSGAWAVAFLLLTALVAALSLVVVRLLGVISAMEGGLGRIQREVSALRAQREYLAQMDAATGPGGLGTAPPGPASVLVVLEPELEHSTSLALDITASGGLHLDVPARVLVADTAAGRALGAELPMPVEYETRQGTVPDGMPSVLVLDAAGSVLTKGTPGSVADLQALVATAG